MKTKPELLIDMQVKRIDLVRRIASRFEKMSSRKKNAMSVSEFCAKHGFHKAHISRVLNLIVFPKQETLSRIDAALKEEKA